MTRYFFFAGAFLAAFLVAICLFSLFDGLHRSCNLKTAVEECIDSREIDVKRKTTLERKKINIDSATNRREGEPGVEIRSVN